ncbi:flagellar motor switch protein FliN [Candidatus Ozemobacteraceae bacterium]|nr:flagellar motor switch protein FliN [Candidatus Ozemobacteraceae bacterium]
MTDLLSQEEIDALLHSGGAGDSGAPTAPAAPASGGKNVADLISQEAIAQLSEVAKLSLGATSSVVQMLLNKPVEINLEQIRVISYGTLASESGTEEFIIAKIAYVEGFDGNSYLLLKKQIAAIIGDLMMGQDGTNAQFQDMHKSAVGEMMNQMMGKTTTTLSEVFKKRVDIAPPQVEMVTFAVTPPPMPDFGSEAHFLRIGFRVKIGDIVETEMIQLQPIDFARMMASELTKPQKVEPRKAPPPPPPGPLPTAAPMPGMMPGMGMPGMGMPSAMPSPMPTPMPGPVPQAMPGMQSMPGMQGMQGIPMQPGMPGMGMSGMPSMHGTPAEFGMLQMPMGMGLQSNIDLLLDVPLQITVELGRTRMLIKDVLELGIGSVVELNKLAGEAVEVFVNSKLIAKGEVVVIDENFAVRITSIVNPQDRLQAL